MEGKHEVPAFPRQTAAAILGLATFAAAPLAHAQDAIAKFYANKNLKLIIGAPTGSRLDVPGRQVARHLGKHIPGHPNIVASDRPGAASNILGRHMFAQASKDRATIGLVFPGVMTEALFNGDDRRGCDPSQFNFGSSGNRVGGLRGHSGGSACEYWHFRAWSRAGTRHDEG